MDNANSLTVLVVPKWQLAASERWSIKADYVVDVNAIETFAEEFKDKFLYITTVSYEAEMAAVSAMEYSKGGAAILAIPVEYERILHIPLFKKFFVSLCYKAASMYVFFKC